MSTPLNPLGGGVAVGRSTLYTPGLDGLATVADRTGAGLRASGGAIAEALERQAMIELETIELRDTRALPRAATGVRAGDAGAIVLETPDPGDGYLQVVLAQDESGVMTWNLPRETEGGAITRGGGSLTYDIRRADAPAPATGTTRGLLGALGVQVLKVLAFKVLEEAVEFAAGRVAERWEARHRPYALRTFTPADHLQPTGAPVPDELWRSGPDAPVLVLLHGTFSRAHHTFAGLPPETLAALHAHYGGRVVAFDHFTLAHDPTRNAQELVSRIAEDADVTVDVLSHSRGGLVGRALAEQASAIGLGGRTVDVRRAVLVAAPNAGTVLADHDRLGDLVDRFTTLLGLLPANGVTDVLDVVITVVKHLAVGAVNGLDGLTAMNPRGDYLAELNRRRPLRGVYHALGSDYEPTEPGLRAFLRDAATDRVFGNAPNDLLVPTAGVWQADGASGFPIDRHVLFGAADGIAHTGYFAHSAARAQMLEWLCQRG